MSNDVQYVFPSQNIRETAAAVYQPTAAQTASGDTGFSFKDIVDAINPLQQLPIIGSIYRAVTGDTISQGSQIMGSALYGGPIGFVVSALTAGISDGKSGGLGDQLLAMATGGGSGNSTSQQQYAAAQYDKMYKLS